MAKKTASETTWKVKAVSGADCVIERTCGKSTQLLVMLVSQDQFYVKRRGAIAMLDEEQLGRFYKGADRIDLGVPWCAPMPNVKPARVRLMDAIRLDMYSDIDTQGDAKRLIAARNAAYASAAVLFRISGESMYAWIPGERLDKEIAFDAVALAYEHPAMIKHLAKHAEDNPAGLSMAAISTLPVVIARFGIDCAKRYADALPAGCNLQRPHIDKVLNVPAEPPIRSMPEKGKVCIGHTPSARRARKAQIGFSFDSWLDYAFTQSAREGYAGNLGSWFDLWGDSLALQMYLYGEVEQKYPKMLASYHDRLSSESFHKDAAYAAERWDEVAKDMERYEDRQGDMMIVAPKGPDELVAEARSQRNCVASYIPRILNGDTWVFFLRKTSAPERSFVTVEVANQDGERVLCQARAGRNGRCPESARAWLELWCRRCGFELYDAYAA